MSRGVDEGVGMGMDEGVSRGADDGEGGRCQDVSRQSIE